MKSATLNATLPACLMLLLLAACSASAPASGGGGDDTVDVQGDDQQGQDTLDPNICTGNPPCKNRGLCKETSPAVCKNNVWACDYTKVPGYEPEESSCNGVDNDCDGMDDRNEFFTELDPRDACPPQKQAGVCIVPANFQYVVYQCVADGSNYSFVCDYSRIPDFVKKEYWGAVAEDPALLCDNKDNDCDGKVDENHEYLPYGDGGSFVPCGQFSGICAVDEDDGENGQFTSEVGFRCKNGVLQCTYDDVPSYEAEEISCDAIDNDCNGVTDDIADMSWAPCPVWGICAPLAGTSVRGMCLGGVWICDTTWLKDVPGYQSEETFCDGLDNDCDGETDEGLSWEALAFPEDCEDGIDNDNDGVSDCDVPACKAFHAGCNGKTPVFADCPVTTDVVVKGVPMKVPKLGKDGRPLLPGVCSSDTDGGPSPVLLGCTRRDVNQDGKNDVWFYECNYDRVDGYSTVERYLQGSEKDLCDGRDNDCDGATDESLTVTGSDVSHTACRYQGACQNNTTATCNKDTNADGKGDSPGKWTCDYGTVAKDVEWGQCQDPNDPHCYWAESSCDGKDNDCDGETDEGLVAGGLNFLRACGDYLDVGVCRKDRLKALCVDKGDGVKDWACDFTALYPDGWSSPEEGNPALCDARDNDCDGKIDEAITSKEPKVLALASCLYRGVCAGTSTAKCKENPAGASDGQWTCDYSGVSNFLVYQDPVLGPREWACDNMDNDCDGLTDEDLDKDFGADAGNSNPRVASNCPSKGVCATGLRWSCEKKLYGGMQWKCDYANLTTYEAVEKTCDNLDNDCDGLTDEELSAPVTTCPGYDKGVCKGKVFAACVKGEWTCGYSTLAGYEAVEASCDGLDNDCDGTADETLDWKTSPGKNACLSKGVCSGGVAARCDGTLGWSCTYGAAPGYEAVEASCDGLDNDCDGSVDEGSCSLCQACTGAASCKSGFCNDAPSGELSFCASSASACVFLEGKAGAGGELVPTCKEVTPNSGGCFAGNMRASCQNGSWSINPVPCQDPTPACYQGICETCTPGLGACSGANRLLCQQKTATTSDWVLQTACVAGQLCFGAGRCITGDERQVDVNASGTFDYFPRPKVTILPGGRVVVVWSSNDPTADGDSSAIMGRIFYDSLLPLAAPFLVNVNTMGVQYRAQVAALPETEGFAVVWEGKGLPDDDGYGVSIRFFDTSGKPTSIEYAVNENPDGDQMEPYVTCSAEGNCFVVWQSPGMLDADGTGIYGRFVNPETGPTGHEILINTTTINWQRTPVAEFLTGGGLVVSWNSTGQDAQGTAVIGQLLTGQGAKTLGEFQLNLYEQQSQKGVSLGPLSLLKSGWFFAAWESTLQDASSTGVFGNVFNKSGLRYVTASDISVAEKTTNAQQAPVVGVLDGDDLVVAWESEVADSAGFGISYRLFAVQGFALGSDSRANVQQTGDQRHPDLAVAPGLDSFVIVWSEHKDGLATVKLRPFRN